MSFEIDNVIKRNLIPLVRLLARLLTRQRDYASDGLDFIVFSIFYNFDFKQYYYHLKVNGFERFGCVGEGSIGFLSECYRN